MKKNIALPLLALFGLCLGPALAAPKAGEKKPGDYKGAAKTAIPANVFGVFSFEDAQKEAAKKKKGLAILITDERADDPAVKSAGIKTFWALEDDAVVVVLRLSTAGEWKRLPATVGAVLSSPDLGKGFPKLLVANDDASVLIAGVNSSALVGMDEKALNKFGKEIKKLNASKTASTDYPPPAPAGAAPATPPATPPGTTVKPAEKPDAPPAKPGAPAPTPAAGPVTIKNPQPESWTNAEGKTIQAALVAVDGENITFDMGGNKVPYDLSKLSEASKKRVEALRAANAK